MKQTFFLKYSDLCSRDTITHVKIEKSKNLQQKIIGTLQRISRGPPDGRNPQVEHPSARPIVKLAT